ncbi:MAG: DNA (cytosine-5-)-methyltransferase [Epsilonproteobacteria bacterium]|nr:DNA (cytosine-5-)-methyltransferase [Campylobacterota bacterium]
MLDDTQLLHKLLEIYDQKYLSLFLDELGDDKWSREKINRWVNGKTKEKFSRKEYEHLLTLLPKPNLQASHEFTFIDLFAGIGGIRKAFENVGGKCLFTSEWNPYAIKTYKANHYNDADHIFNEDIRDITLSQNHEISNEEAYKHINSVIPDHDVLLAGFPCQPFSIAGVSKKNSLGRSHGFECQTQGTLFFDVARILAAKRPKAFLLENVKNLKSHDKGKTFQIIMQTLDELGYWVADANVEKNVKDPKIIDAQHFLPQHRERIVLVGFKKELNVHHGFSLQKIRSFFPDKVITLGEILEPEKQIDEQYILTPKLWEYLWNYAKKHKEKGNGFGFGLVQRESITRTLSARYYKDGSEILVDRGFNFNMDFHDKVNMQNRPRRLTPRECARLMGFEKPGESNFKIPVSDTQAYKQFGNSVVVPVFEAVAKLMKTHIVSAIEKEKIELESFRYSA